jgi:hypothetical protein
MRRKLVSRILEIGRMEERRTANTTQDEKAERNALDLSEYLSPTPFIVPPPPNT